MATSDENIVIVKADIISQLDDCLSLSNSQDENEITQVSCTVSEDLDLPTTISEEACEVVASIGQAVLNLFSDSSEETIKYYLLEVVTRFNTSPKVYTKEDFMLLIRLIATAVIHLYEENDSRKSEIDELVNVTIPGIIADYKAADIIVLKEAKEYADSLIEKCSLKWKYF